MIDISIGQIIFLLLFSGFISIDRLAGLNIMISRPVVVSGIIGIFFGDIYGALLIGLIFEFIGMLEVPVGSTIAHDDTFGGYVGSVALILGYIKLDAVNLLAAILLISLLMYPVTLSDRWFRWINGYLVHKSIIKNKIGNENKLIFMGVFLSFIRGIVIYNIALIILLLLMSAVNIINLDFISLYDPIIALTIIATFMGGYLIRFLIINKLYKVILLILGAIAGWVII